MASFDLYFKLVIGVALFYSGPGQVFHFFSLQIKEAQDFILICLHNIFFLLFDNTGYSNYTADLLIM